MTDRPKTLREISLRVEDLRHFGLEFADWLHTVRTLRTRPQVATAISEEPVFLRNRFPEGAIADAWLAAYAEYISQQIDTPVPAWTKSPERVAPKPWFASEIPAAQLRALNESPAPFRDRNLFTDAVDLPLRLRAGRPPKTTDEKRRTNAERQRRFRNRRALELELHRHAGKMIAGEK